MAIGWYPEGFIRQTGIASEEAFGTPTVGFTGTITAQAIVSEEAFGTPTIS